MIKYKKYPKNKTATHLIKKVLGQKSQQRSSEEINKLIKKKVDAYLAQIFNFQASSDITHQKIMTKQLVNYFMKEQWDNKQQSNSNNKQQQHQHQVHRNDILKIFDKSISIQINKIINIIQCLKDTGRLTNKSYKTINDISLRLTYCSQAISSFILQLSQQKVWCQCNRVYCSARYDPQYTIQAMMSIIYRKTGIKLLRQQQRKQVRIKQNIQIKSNNNKNNNKTKDQLELVFFNIHPDIQCDLVSLQQIQKVQQIQQQIKINKTNKTTLQNNQSTIANILQTKITKTNRIYCSYFNQQNCQSIINGITIKQSQQSIIQENTNTNKLK